MTRRHRDPAAVAHLVRAARAGDATAIRLIAGYLDLHPRTRAIPDDVRMLAASRGSTFRLGRATP